MLGIKSMHCPKCNAPFSYASSWKIWNPYKFPCPACGCILKLKYATKMLLLIGLSGVAVGVFSSRMERAGIWQTLHSVIFCAAVCLAIALLHYYLWKRKKFIFTYDT